MFVSKALALFALALAANAAALPQARSEPSYMHGTQKGDATYYTPGLGACGQTSTSDDLIVAVSHSLYDTYPGYKGTNPNNNPVCGRKINAHWGGKSVTVKVVDRCTGCAVTDLDFSPAAFKHLSPLSAGRLHGMTWTWA
ncbi:plant expansin [Coniophora puteana RWD-64-598 SS2]|uniref:Plant expansin n=1 Tax=Coniophora puteana (strain RWD-64-598) TaxID=741705 RepID=A0A5M3MRY6_CONPW|nr:plant expansin [Coniophora puteana RWD-64-598 SS2]EIW81913.1 plant expansin [Coniophora puteana RWD-64-598 SS2]